MQTLKQLKRKRETLEDDNTDEHIESRPMKKRKISSSHNISSSSNKCNDNITDTSSNGMIMNTSPTSPSNETSEIDKPSSQSTENTMEFIKIDVKSIYDKNEEITELLKILKESMDIKGCGFHDNVQYFINLWTGNQRHLWTGNPFIILGKINDKIVCFSYIEETEEMVSIIILEAFEERKGFGKSMVQYICTINKKVKASSVMVQSRAFWNKMKFVPDKKDVEQKMFNMLGVEHLRYIIDPDIILPIDQDKVYIYHQCNKHIVTIITKKKYKQIWEFIVNYKEVDYEYKC